MSPKGVKKHPAKILPGITQESLSFGTGNFFFWISIHTTSVPCTAGTHTDGGAVERDNVVYWKTNRKIMDDLVEVQ